MSRLVSILALAVLAATAAPGHAAATAGQEQPAAAIESPLLHASLHVQVLSPHAAQVHGEFQLGAGDSLELLLVHFPEQFVSALEMAVDGEPIAAPQLQSRGTAMRFLELTGRAFGSSARSTNVSVHYRVETPAFRYALPVPTVAVSGGGAVELEVVLPPGATYAGDAFPRLAAVASSGQGAGSVRLFTTMIAVPAFVHVPFESVEPVALKRLSTPTPTATGGLGWSFYGFFLFAAAWCGAYFAWAVRANRRAND